MKAVLSFTLPALLALAACGGSRVPSSAVENSGIINSQRDGNIATILYQDKSTRSGDLKAEANRICRKIGKNAGSMHTERSNSRIPGVDMKARFTCY